jgi:ABC-type branched-subunit amino acid transport system substrate-binding protein
VTTSRGYCGELYAGCAEGEKIAVIHDKDTYGQGLADATRAALAKRGTKEVLYEGLSRARRTSTRW